MMNKSIFVWATSLCLMVSVSGMRAGDKLSLKTITSGEFRSEVMQAVCPPQRKGPSWNGSMIIS